MDGKEAQQSMGNKVSSGSTDLEDSIDVEDYDVTMSEFVTPKSVADKNSTKPTSSTPLNMDNSEDETSDSGDNDGDASLERNITQRKQKNTDVIIAEEEGSKPPSKKQKLDQNLIAHKSNATDNETSQNSVFLGKFNFRAMDEQKRRFLETAAATNKTIRLSLPKTNQRLKGFGFLELVSEDASELRDTLEELLECPRCFERLHPPATCCVNGHALCKKCEDQGVDQCSVCNALFVKGQYYLMNNVIKYFQFRCKFAEYGCIFRATPHELSAHEKLCNYRVVKCPLSKEGNVCGEIVPIPLYPDHVQDSHESYVKTPFTLNVDYECVLPKKEKLEKGNIFYRFFKDVVNKLNFLEMTHYDETFKMYTISVHLIGKETEASNFVYTIDVTGDTILKQFKCSRDCLPNIMTASEAEKYFLFTLPDRDDKFSVRCELKYNLRIEKKEDFDKSSNWNSYEETFCEIPTIDL